MVTRLRRYWQIADILLKYEFGSFVQRLFPGTYRLKRCKECPVEPVTTVYQRMREAIEELGPTFIKFGQILSTRQDMLPPELIRELKKLQDNANPLPYEKVRKVIESNCSNPDECFFNLEQTPLASASISQVHRATLRDGTPIVLKVQRPGIRDVIETDLLILESFAARLDRHYPQYRVYNPKGLVRDFASQIRKELDFIRDGSNADRLRHGMHDMEGIRVPKIYWEFSTSQLLVMEYVEGVRVDNIEKIREFGVDPVMIADRGFYAYMKQIFENGFFHGDPHPGNLLVTKDGQLVFLDFGIVGIIRPERRMAFIKFLEGLVTEDPTGILKGIEGLGVTIRDLDREELRDEIYEAMLESSESRIGQTSFKGMADGLTDVLRRFRIVVPTNLMLMLKVIIMVLDVGVTLDPGFSFREKAEPYARKLATKEALGDLFSTRARHSLSEAIDGFFDLPRNVNKTLKALSTGTIKIDIIDTDIRKLQLALDRTSDRILLGLVTAGIVVGSSLVLLASDVKLPNVVFWLAVLGYILAILVGFYAIYDAIFQNDSE
jgi:ubiquinone biosynthesis protein